METGGHGKSYAHVSSIINVNFHLFDLSLYLKSTSVEECYDI